MGDRAGEEVLELIELVLLIVSAELRSSDLVDLEAQQIDLSCTAAHIAAQRSKRCVDLGEARPCCAQWSQVDAAEAIEGRPLRRCAQQALVGVLTVQIHQPDADVGQGADGCQAAVQVGTRTSVRRDHPRQHVLFVLTSIDAGYHEATLHPRLGRAWTNDGGVGAPSDKKVDGLHKHGLAGAGFTSEGGEPHAEHEVQPGDHAQIFDVQFREHQRVPFTVSVRRRVQRSVRPNFAFRIWWKRRGPNRTKRAVSAAGTHVRVSPSWRVTTRWPSTETSTGR